MQLHDLKPSPGSHHRPKRVGRGTGSGHGKTSGRGQKGQNARSEGFRLGFEGGQMPFAQRIPKLPGFKNPFKKIYSVVNISKLSRFPDGTKVDADTLLHAGLVRDGLEIKILGTGNLKRKLTVEAHAFSTSARETIEKAGGSVTVLGEPRKIGPRRTAAKAPRPVPEPTPVAAAKPPREKKGAAPAAVEEATPPTSPRAGKAPAEPGDGETPTTATD
jgi:large subunit ribosomal protein L15